MQQLFDFLNVFSTVITDARMLKQKSINIHGAVQVLLDPFQTIFITFIVSNIRKQSYTWINDPFQCLRFNEYTAREPKLRL